MTVAWPTATTVTTAIQTTITNKRAAGSRKIGGVETLVGSQQSPQCLPALQGEVLLARQQRVFLALDEAALLPRQTRILALSHLIEGFAQVANDVELVEQDRGLRGVGVGGVAKRLPHVHHGEPDAPTL